MATKVKALQMWCKKMTDGYRDVEVRDMTSSWKNGLAFCAIIHRHRPDLIDYDALSKENIFDNNQLAFEVAEKELGIPALLDAPDMVAIRVPDKLSVVTYVSQYYNYFCNKPQLGGPGVKKPSTLKRTQATPSGPDAKRQSLGPNDGTPSKERQISMGDKCAICHKKVYLLERHVNEGQLYHRTCFRSSDDSPQRKINKRLDAMGERKNDENKSVQDKKGEEPNFWKRRADAKKAESKSNGHINGEADKGHMPDKNHNSGGVLSSLVHNLKGSDSKSKQPAQHNVHTDSKDKAEVTSRPADLNIDSHSVDIKNNKNLDSVGGTQESNVKLNIVPPQPRARHVVKIGAFKEKRDEEPMDTTQSSDSILSERQSAGNILNRTKTTNDPEGKMEEEKSIVAQPRARRVVKIGAKKEESDTRAHSKSPVQSKPITSVQTPETLSKIGAKNDDESRTHKQANSKSVITAHTSESPPPLPSSLPPTVKPSTPSSPPPLPSNLPPRLQTTAEPSISPSKLSKDKSPSASAHSSHFNKNSHTHVPGLKESPKAKPRHSKATDEKISKEKNDPTSSLVSPTKQDQELLGGLLKNLAGIRQRKSSSESSDKSPLSPIQGLSSKLQNIPESKESRKDIKSLDIDAEKKKDRAGKSKSDFLSGKLAVISKESGSVGDSPKNVENKSKPHLTSDEDDDVPAWKKALEERKKKLRPKSEDVFNEESQVNEPAWKSALNKKNVNRPKSMDILSEIDKEKDQKPAWQLEAEKRMAANEKGFVDPEKNRIDQGTKKTEKTENSKPRPYTAYGELESRSKSPVSGWQAEVKEKESNESKSKSRILPTTPSDGKQLDTDKKKISVGTKFKFNLNFKDKDKEKDPGKPPRPPTSPAEHKSKKGPSDGDTSGTHSPPLRPPAPRSTEVKTFGDVKRLTPREIQKQLSEIDHRLTDLEIRGRTLEDSIRKAQEEEEDEVMMVEWFKLVNEKNELVRQEADLIYRSRAQELEDEQHDIDMKLRRLIKKPEFMRTEEDEKEEEFLLNKLVEIVNQRSLIVDSQDEDRIRYEEEDREIAEILASKGFCKEPKSGKKEGKHEKKKKKEKKKDKEKSAH